MDPVNIAIPERKGNLRGGEFPVEGVMTMDSQIFMEAVDGPVALAVEGAWEGVGGGAFEGAAEGGLNLTGTGTSLGTAEPVAMTVNEDDRAIEMLQAEATTGKLKGKAVWRARERYTFTEDLLTGGTGQGHFTVQRSTRVNTPTMIWAFLYKAPRYINPDDVGGVSEGPDYIGEIPGDRWLIACDRAKVGQKMCLNARHLHLRNNEKMWVLVITGRRGQDEEGLGQDFVHIAMGVVQRTNYY
jgi:hypothetical protein